VNAVFSIKLGDVLKEQMPKAKLKYALIVHCIPKTLENA
jgi:hypothetical protein